MKSTIPFQKKVEKPWGHEIIFTPADLPFTGKIMVVDAGKRWSLHFHDQKLETLCLFSGEAIIWLEDDAGEMQKIPMKPFVGYTISVNQKHRIETIQESFILEASMPEVGTTVRVEDDFQRSNETEEVRKDPNRGWDGK